MVYNSLVGANLIKSMQEKDLLRYPINFFRTLRINLTGFYEHAGLSISHL